MLRDIAKNNGGRVSLVFAIVNGFFEQHLPAQKNTLNDIIEQSLGGWVSHKSNHK